jgi:hypothetical protein
LGLVDGLVTHRRKIFVPADSSFIPIVLAATHSLVHEGVQKPLHRLCNDFYILGDRTLVADWVCNCDTCQRNKTKHLHPDGLLQPLAAPQRIWMDISIDFVEGLPKVYGKSVILRIMDRFSKYAHFIALSYPYTASSVARLFFDEVVRLHGFPASVVSGRDPTFTSNFWRELFHLSS